MSYFFFKEAGNPELYMKISSVLYIGNKWFFFECHDIKKIYIILSIRLLFFLIMNFIYFFKFYFIFKLYNIVLVLPNIEMNPPQVYPRSPSWTLLPPPSTTLPLGRPSAPAPSIQHHASNLDWRLVSYMILYMFQCYSPKSPHPLPLPQSP